MRALISSAIAAAIAIVVPQPHAAAAPLSYSETAHGELGSSLPAATPLAFDVGINTVSGRMGMLGGTLGADFDSFAFSIPAGTELFDIDFHATYVGFPYDGLNVAATFHLCSSNAACPSGPTQLGAGVLNLSFAAIDLFVPFGSDPQLGPGVYGMSNAGWTRNNFAGWNPVPDQFSDYWWSFKVRESAAVPEPGALALAGLGLAALAVLRRRRR